LCITTTPRPVLLLKNIMKEPGTVITRGSTLNNRANLAAKFLDRIVRKYQGTRLGRQELDAEILEDLEGALWRRSVIDEYRVKLSDTPEFRRIVVAIDPATSSEDESNSTGILVCGLGADGDGYVLDDASGIYAPLEWAREAIPLYRARQADRVVAEVNNGGDMIENTLRMVDRNVSYGRVWASKGKFIRAEPVSSLYEQRRVHQVGSSTKLEDQMCNFTADFDRKTMGYSPDRMDALVWALTELMGEPDARRPLFVSA
jgi:phage terminase large subunit-like protein